MWKLREEVSDAQKREGASVKNDVTVPVSKMPEFITRATADCERRFPGVRVMAFGHMGDGNIHFNLEQPVGGDNAAFMRQITPSWTRSTKWSINLMAAFRRSTESAPSSLPDGGWRGGAELETMRKIKAALDPLGIMNPARFCPAEARAVP